MRISCQKNHSGFNKKSGESRLVFKQWSAFDEDQLPKTYVQGESPLENSIERLKEKESKTRRKAIQETLSAQRSSCETYMETLKKPIKTSEEFKEVQYDILNFDHFLKRIQSADLSELTLSDLLDADIHHFFDDRLTKKLKRTTERMKGRSNALSILKMTGSLEVKQAAKEWKNHAKALKQEGFKKKEWISKRALQLQAEKSAWQEQEGAKKNADQDLSAYDEGMRELIRRQAESEEIHESRLHRITLETEKHNLVSLADQLSYEEKAQINGMLLEAREIRLEQVREYLRERMQKAIEAFHAKKANLDDEEQKTTIETWLNQTHEKIGGINNIQEAKQLDQNITQFEGLLEEGSSKLENTKRNQEALLKELPERLAAVENKLKAFTPEVLETLKAKAEIPAQKKMLDQLAGVLKGGKWITEFKAQLQDPEGISNTELQTIDEELGQLEKILAFVTGEKIDQAVDPEKRNNATRARQAINALKNVRNINEIKTTLSETIGDEHVEYVDNSTFEAKYRAYTTTGHMVFYERGDEWKIIIDEEALQDKNNVKDLKKQVTHELLHVEFENNPQLKAHWLEAFTQNEHWNEIKQAYVNAFPAKKPAQYEGENKASYTANDWEDEDILSELFAMQNELGQRSVKDDGSPLAHLNNLLLSSGVMQAANGLNPNTGKEIIRGNEGGVDDANVAAALEQAENEDTEGESDMEDTTGSPQQFDEKIDEIEAQIKEILESEYLPYLPGAKDLLHLMKKYNENTRKLNEALRENSSAFLNKVIQGRLEQVEGDVKEMTPMLAEVGGKIANQKIGPFRNIWNNTSFLSIEDLIQVGKDVFEFVKRRHERKSKDHAAKLGEALFSKLPFLGDLGAEATARKEKAEQEEVEEWKSRYSSLDAWALQSIIDKLATAIDPNKDQLKAVLRILGEKGRIDWRNENLWRVLNKLQNATHLTPGDPVLLHNPPLLRQKLHTAMGQIWDYDEFLSLEKQNEDAYEGEKKKFYPSLDKIQDQLTVRLEQLMRMHRNGEKVEPQEFEAILEYSIENGKSYAENIMFFLMVGMAEGLLTQDRGLSLDKHLNTWPATQWIYSKAPPLTAKDYKKYCEEFFLEEYRKGAISRENSRFKTFYWSQVQNDPMTIQRVRKSVSERSWDHDWGRSIAAMGDAHTAKRFFQGQSGQENAKDTGIENAVVGALQWFEENGKVMDQIDFRKQFARQMAWTAMADGIMDDVAYQKATGAPFTRGHANILNAIAREAAVGNHGDWTVQRHREKMQTFLDSFDRPFFEMLRDRETAKDDHANNRNTLAMRIQDYLIRRYPSQTAEWRTIRSLDHVFDKMDLIMQTITSAEYVTKEDFKQRVKTHLLTDL